MTVRIRPAIAGLPSYVPGKPAAADQVSYKLSSNENPFPPLPEVIEATRRAIERMNRYPDMANGVLAETVSRKLGVSPDQLVFGAGSVAVLYHLLQACCEPGDEVVYAWRSFEAYPIAVQLTGATGVRVPLGPGAVHDLDAMLAAITPATRAVLLCTPNNPTGPALSHDAVADFVAAVRDDVLILVDEAYVEFVRQPGVVRGLDLAAEHPNVAVLRTFSKAYGLAGFRVGYGIAEPALAAAARAASLPFGVSIAAQAAALAALECEEALLKQVESLVAERDSLLSGLRDLGFDVPDAQGNFVWLPAGSQTESYAAAFGAAGLIVRPFAGDGIRISVGEPEANARVLDVAATLTR